MLKKTMSIILALILTLSLILASCGTRAPSKEPDGTGTGEEPLKIALVVNQKFGDKGPMDDLAKVPNRRLKILEWLLRSLSRKRGKV